MTYLRPEIRKNNDLLKCSLWQLKTHCQTNPHGNTLFFTSSCMHYHVPISSQVTTEVSLQVHMEHDCKLSRLQTGHKPFHKFIEYGGGKFFVDSLEVRARMLAIPICLMALALPCGWGVVSHVGLRTVGHRRGGVGTLQHKSCTSLKLALSLSLSLSQACTHTHTHTHINTYTHSHVHTHTCT